MPPASAARPKGLPRVTAREERAAATRENLVDAGLRLAEQSGLAGMSVNLIVGKAGVAKGTFFHHFADRAGFLLALHTEFHDRLFADIAEAVAGLPPGRDRLLAAARAYLHGCLRHRGIRAPLLQAPAQPVITHALARRHQQARQLVTPDLP